MNDATETINYSERAEILKDIYRKVSQTKATAEELYADRRKPIDESIANLEQAFREANAELLDVLDEARTNQADAEQELRQIAVEHYEVTGVKSLDDNLGVRVNTKFQYSVKDAVKWAETNAPVMITKSVDKKAFESLPTVADLDFVTKEESVSAVLKGLK